MSFVGEPISPLLDFIDTTDMVTGGPGFPMRFLWRKKEYEVAKVLEKWKELSPCRNGGDERYVRKHWFKVVTTDNEVMKIYCERQARSPQQRKKRWWLYTLEQEERTL